MSKGVSIVVGASGFIGQSVFKELKWLGYNVIGTSTKGDANENLLSLDLNDRSSIAKFAEEFKKIDNLIVAAGREPQSSLMELEEDHFDKMIAIHYAGPLWLVKQLQAKFSSEASIVFCSSVAAYKGSYDPTYSSLKGAVNSLVRTLARELAPNVRVNAIAPSIVDTPLASKFLNNDIKMEKANERHPLGRIGTAEELADVTAFLLGDKSSWMTGRILQIDGGIGNLKT